MEATIIKERPILMNGEMVRAVLSGRKTQTRRDAKLPLPPSIHQPLSWHWEEKRWLFSPAGAVGHIENPKVKWGVKCPYGAVGDQLWVRETWRVMSDEKLRTPELSRGRHAGRICYAADEYPNEHPGEYRPSIHMPRWASRITLEITGVRVERLNGITPKEAIAEGIDMVNAYHTEPPLPYPVATFKRLWESINGPGSWAANPWVWVIEFKKVEA